MQSQSREKDGHFNQSTVYRGEVEGDSVLPENHQLELRDFMGSAGRGGGRGGSISEAQWGFLHLYALIKYSLRFTGHGHMLNGTPRTSQGCADPCLPVQGHDPTVRRQFN